jgi:hypothetical protein
LKRIIEIKNIYNNNTKTIHYLTVILNYNKIIQKKNRMSKQVPKKFNPDDYVTMTIPRE